MYINHKIVIEDNSEKKERFFCAICKYPLITREDFEKSAIYKSCNDCYMTFIENKKQSWRDGWRPTKEITKDYINLKKQLSRKIINITEE
tara:strand:- start:974 stop:1243 length:270 start_codon:yes stop_codon:yes gene_type:complete